MRYRAISKLKGTYVDALPALINPKTKRIHTTFNQATAATGRLSSNDPNLQNIPVRTGYGNRIRQRVRRTGHRQGTDAAAPRTTLRSSCGSWPSSARTQR